MERFVHGTSTPRRCAAALLLLAAWGSAARGQETPGDAAPPPAAAAVEALRKREFAEALRIVEEARPVVAAARGEDDPAVLTLRVLGAQAEYGLGRPEGAVALLDPFLRTVDAPAVLVSVTSDWNALNVLGDSLMALDRWEEALRCLDRAWTLVAGEEAPADRVPGRSRGVDRATTLGKIGTVKARLGDWDGARRAFEAQRDALAQEPDGGGPFLAAAHSGLGLVADNTGDHVTAGLHYAEAAAIYDRAFGPEHPYAKRSRETLERSRSRSRPRAAAEGGPGVVAPAGGDPGDGSGDAAEPVAEPAAGPRTARPGWPALAGGAAALVLAWLVWSGFLRRAPATDDRPDDDEAEG